MNLGMDHFLSIFILPSLEVWSHQIPSETPEPSTVPGKEQLSSEHVPNERKRSNRVKELHKNNAQ